MNRITNRTLKAAMRELSGCAEHFEWTQEQWAAKAGISVQTLYNMKHGNYTLGPNLNSLCCAAAAVHNNLVLAEAGSVELRLQSKPRLGVRINRQGKVQDLADIKPKKRRKVPV